MSKPAEMNPVKRLYNAPPEKRFLRMSINAMCATCVGCTASEQGERFKDYMERGWRNAVKHCPVESCPLHHLRPYQQRKQVTCQD